MLMVNKTTSCIENIISQDSNMNMENFKLMEDFEKQDYIEKQTIKMSKDAKKRRKDLLNRELHEIFIDIDHYRYIKNVNKDNNGDVTSVDCEEITNFILDIKEFVTFEESNMSELKIVLKNNKGKVSNRTMLSSDFTDSKSFKSALAKIDVDFTFLGSEMSFKYFRINIFDKEFKRKIGIDRIGMFKDEDGKYIAFDSETNLNSNVEFSDKFVVSDKFKEIESNILSKNFISDNEFDQICSSMFKFNELSKCVAIWGFVGACFLKPRLNDLKIKIPHLQLIGEAGSGKSATLENIIMPLFDLNKNNTNSSTCITKFSLIKSISSSNVMPSVLEEYKPYKMPKNIIDIISSLLRSTYDGHTIKRGKTDQGVNSYRLTAPIVLIGECGIDETAIHDRSMIVDFSKIFHTEEFKRCFLHLKKNDNVLSNLGKSLFIEALKIDSEELKEIYYKHLAKIEDFEINSRQLEGIAVLMTGLELFDKVIPNFLDQCYLKEEELYNLFINQKEEKTKSIVENTLEIYDRVGNLEKGWHFDIKNTKDGECFVLDVKNTYDKVKKYCAEHKIDDEILTRQQFTKQLMNSKYFVKYSNCKMRVAYDSIADSEEKKDSMVAKKVYFLNYKMMKEELEMYYLIKCD